MPRFFMFIQIASAKPHSLRAIREHAGRISSQLVNHYPSVQLIDRHIVQNHCDLVDLVDAPAIDVVEQAANMIESLGHRVIDLMAATQWEHAGPTSSTSLTNPAKPDPVQEASEESFPASDPPAWTGTTASETK